MRTAAFLLFGLASSACSAPAICDGVTGGCLVLHVDGNGSFENLRGTALSSSLAILKSGEIAQSVTLPTTLRLQTPPGVNSDTINALRIDGVQNSQVVSYGLTPTGFTWPNGTNTEVTVTLAAGNPVPPGPLLTWREEMGPTGFAYLLYDVWADPSGDPVLAVGENGSALRRSGGTWSAEATGLGTSLLNSVAGISGGIAWTVGQLPASAARRDGTLNTWTGDQPTMLTGKGFWCVTAGANPGELWAGDDDGKVWHRTGATNAAGTWTSELALPNVGVYGIAYAGGAIFAVGDAGNVAVRKDSMAGTAWTQAKITGNFSASDWWNGVWAFDKNTAVAVGTSGSLVTYQGGAWSQSAQKIDPDNSEMMSVWGQTPNRLWVTSRNGFLLRVDGTNTYKLYTKAGQGLFSVYGLNDSDIYVVGGKSGEPSLLIHGTL